MAAPGSVSEPDNTAPQPRFARLRNWGSNLRGAVENVERRHFDGNFLEAIRNAPVQVGERASRIGEELGTAAVKLVEEAQGRGLPEGNPGTILSAEDMTPSMSLDQFLDASQPPPCASSSRPGVWEECEQLRRRLDEEREMRRGRALALNALDEALRGMRTELLEEKRLLAEAEEARLARCTSLEAIERTIEELQEEHDRVQSQKVAVQARLRRLGDDAAARARQERQATREGAWAREGPETEALMLAKLELAELLGQHDEVKLRGRQEVADLTIQIATAKAETAELHNRKDVKVKPTSFRGAIGRFIKTTARGAAGAVAGGDGGQLQGVNDT